MGRNTQVSKRRDQNCENQKQAKSHWLEDKGVKKIREKGDFPSALSLVPVLKTTPTPRNSTVAAWQIKWQQKNSSSSKRESQLFSCLFRFVRRFVTENWMLISNSEKPSKLHINETNSSWRCRLWATAGRENLRKAFRNTETFLCFWHICQKQVPVSASLTVIEEAVQRFRFLHGLVRSQQEIRQTRIICIVSGDLVAMRAGLTHAITNTVSRLLLQTCPKRSLSSHDEPVSFTVQKDWISEETKLPQQTSTHTNFSCSRTVPKLLAQVAKKFLVEMRCFVQKKTEKRNFRNVAIVQRHSRRGYSSCFLQFPSLALAPHKNHQPFCVTANVTNDIFLRNKKIMLFVVEITSTQIQSRFSQRTEKTCKNNVFQLAPTNSFLLHSRSSGLHAHCPTLLLHPCSCVWLFCVNTDRSICLLIVLFAPPYLHCLLLYGFELQTVKCWPWACYWIFDDHFQEYFFTEHKNQDGLLETKQETKHTRQRGDLQESLLFHSEAALCACTCTRNTCDCAARYRSDSQTCWKLSFSNHLTNDAVKRLPFVSAAGYTICQQADRFFPQSFSPGCNMFVQVWPPCLNLNVN